MSRRIAVIMAGGSGERFWPLSRPHRPKQLLKLTSPTQTMLEEAVERIAPLVGHKNVFVATSSGLADVVRASGVVHPERVLAEPAKRNTLGCLSWFAAHLLSNDEEDASVAILTADHLIRHPNKFRATVDAALDLAEETLGLVTIGIKPDRPETGYGYIEAHAEGEVRTAEGRVGFRSASFREKPSEETARGFLAAGNFYWNSGMFFFTVQAFMRELEGAQPEAARLVRQMAQALRQGQQSAAEEAFECLPGISIDFAVMEKAKDVYVVPSDFPWDDVGAWDSLERTLTPDADGNVVQGRAVLLDSRGCIVVSDGEATSVGVLGMEDVIVVVTADATLVLPKRHAQRVREVTKALENL